MDYSKYDLRLLKIKPLHVAGKGPDSFYARPDALVFTLRKRFFSHISMNYIDSIALNNEEARNDKISIPCLYLY